MKETIYKILYIKYKHFLFNVVTEIWPVKVQEHEPGGQDEVHHLPRHLHLLTHQGNRGIMVTNCSTWKILNNATLSFTFDFDYVCR